eukprot:1109817-Prorocentrum_minimum.AAC.1
MNYIHPTTQLTVHSSQLADISDKIEDSTPYPLAPCSPPSLNTGTGYAGGTELETGPRGRYRRSPSNY